MKNYFVKLLTLGILCFPLVSCNRSSKKKDISIIYTSDVHCGLDENLGYSSVYSYKEKLSKTNYVTLVDSGDYLQGDFIGAISSGKYCIDVMNKTGYDIVTLGNHEFDYGVDVLATRLHEFKGEVTSCNFSYTGSKENKFNFVKPYVIKDYGYKKVGFIGITTPSTLVESDPKNFKEDDQTVYSFGAETVEGFYSLVQSNIDSCKLDGADYIFALSHLGSLDYCEPYSSLDVIAHTSGVTAFLDGHCHINLPWKTYKNKDNVDTLLVDTGYKLNDFASITISKKGKISHEFITEYSDKSEEITNYVNEIKKGADELGNKVVANIDVDLSISDSNGVRMIRNREMPIGNLVADAYRIIANADIGVTNGGGIRTDLHKGDVTYKDIKNVHPFGNVLMKKKVTGQMILDYLEFTSMNTKDEYVKDGKPNGESGAFAHVSGLKYTIDTSTITPVAVDEKGEFIGIDGPRRVQNVQVLENGVYVDIDPNKEYIIASHNYLLESGGDGANMFKSAEVVPDAQIFDYEVLIKYIAEVLKGHLSEKYSSTEGRINIIF